MSEKKTRSTMFLLKTLTHSYMFILYFVEEENICHYCLQAFSTEETLKCHINDSSKANGKQKINMSNLKIMKEKQKCHL